MSGDYFSFPQRPPDDPVPTISKIYNTVHKRLASIVSQGTNSGTSNIVSESVVPESSAVTTSDRVNVPAAPKLAEADATATHQLMPLPPTTEGSDQVSYASRTIQKTSALSNTVPFQAAPKAEASVHSEPLTVLGDTDYIDIPVASPTKSRDDKDKTFDTNNIPGFALQREISSESETQESPTHTRRPSLIREDSISTVLTRLKSGRLSKEFWMKDQNAHACFRCEATFNST